MKLLYSHRTRSADGQRVHIRGLTDALKARGVDVKIVGPRPGDNSLTATASKPPTASFPREGAEALYSLYGFYKLSKAARRFGPDVIYERYNLFYRAGMALARRRKIPFLLEVNAPLVEERAKTNGLKLKTLAQKMEQEIWTGADAIFSVSTPLAERIAGAGVDPARIHVTPNGVEPAFLQPADPTPVRERFNLQENHLVLGFCGFVRDWHGVDRVVAAMAREVALRDARLLIVGDGPAVPGLRSAAASSNIGERIIVTGVVQREDMPAHIAAFDVALQPRVTAYASPLKLFEYMAQSRAIIAPDAPNISEIVRDQEHALLTPAGDDQAFGRALSALARSPDLRARLGAAAREELRRRDFTWAGAAARVEQVASQMVRTGSK
ncbi:MAG: glycosyltransferase family 4 protein [Pseudomonadota bacterium]